MDGKKGGLSPKTLRNIKVMISEALNYAVNNLRILEHNPIAGLKLPKVVRRKINVLSQKSRIKLERTSLAYDKTMNALMIYLNTGLRIGKYCGLMWPDFSPNKEYVNFHVLRHTFATRANELGIDIPTIGEILGHAQNSTTLNMYGHSVDDHKIWLREEDLNLRPSGYEPDELPNCSIPRYEIKNLFTCNFKHLREETRKVTFGL